MCVFFFTPNEKVQIKISRQNFNVENSYSSSYVAPLVALPNEPRRR